MKKLFWILVLFVIAFFILSSPASSYELSNKDYDIIDMIDEKIIQLIDSRENLSAEKVVNTFNNYLEKKNLSERHEVIIETVIDDIKYEYYLWEYSEWFITAEDCYDDEYFNTIEQACFIKDDTNIQNIEKNYLEDLESKVTHSESEDFSEETEEILAKYEIKQNEILLLDGKHTEENKDLWDIFVKIIPQAYRSDFLQYNVYNNPDSDTDAHVTQDEGDYKKWNLSINLVGFLDDAGNVDEKKSIETLIHEFAHVLTLWKTQVKYVPLNASDDFWEKANSDCSTYFVWEWCLNSQSFMKGFIDTFWKENFIASQDDQEDSFYLENEDSFVTEYAATNPWEDIAESFTYFVLQPKPESANKIADSKLIYFYQYPELIKLRNFIRMRIAK